MKKKKHIILILSEILFLLGALLILAGMILGVDYDELTISSNFVTTKTVSHTIETTASNDPSTVHKLDLDLFAGNIIIKNGDDFSISGGKLSKNVIEDGVWKVKTSKHKKLSRLIRHTFTSSDTHNKTITITIPDSAASDILKRTSRTCDIISGILKRTIFFHKEPLVISIPQDVFSVFIPLIKNFLISGIINFSFCT